MMSRILLIIVVLINGLKLYGQKTDPCIQQVKEAYKKLESISQPPTLEGKTFYVNYSVRTVLKDSLANSPAQTVVEMWLSKKQLQLKSKEMEVYQDEDDVFAVLPQKKLIVRSDAIPFLNQNERQHKISIIQDTLFSMSKVVSCTKLKKNEAGADKLIVLETSEKGRKALGIKRVSFFINDQKTEVKKVRLEYDTEKQIPGMLTDIRFVEYTINQCSFDYKDKKLSNHIEALFMRSRKELLPVYKSYKLVDNRVKKNPIK